ncbi:MAG: dynein regulation protein LC7 [Microcystaceae cyanobacterium]
MPLAVNPIVYTSFPKVGFQSLASPSVPIEVQQTFLEQIVYQQWDTYNPPPSGYRAVYLYQVTAEQCLFGWLYNDGDDDLGRSNIPYFVAYHFPSRLSSRSLEQILNFLELGPPIVFDRQTPPKQLENIVIADSGNYEPARRGLTIESDTRQKIHRDLQQKRVIRLFIGLKMPETTTLLNAPLEQKMPEIPQLEPSNQVQPAALLSHESPSSLENISSSHKQSSSLEDVLTEFVKKPIGIQGVVLISSEGQLILPPVGMDEDMAMLTGGRMLYLAQSTQDELNWQNVDNISIRGQEGHLVLSRCDNDTFLLVKTGKALTGLLEAEINRFIKQLQPMLNSLAGFSEYELEETNGHVESDISPNPPPLPKLETPEKEIVYEEYEYEYEYEEDDEISYRGRRLN